MLTSLLMTIDNNPQFLSDYKQCIANLKDLEKSIISFEDLNYKQQEELFNYLDSLVQYSTVDPIVVINTDDLNNKLDEIVGTNNKLKAGIIDKVYAAALKLEFKHDCQTLESGMCNRFKWIAEASVDDSKLRTKALDLLALMNKIARLRDLTLENFAYTPALKPLYEKEFLPAMEKYQDGLKDILELAKDKTNIKSDKDSIETITKMSQQLDSETAKLRFLMSNLVSRRLNEPVALESEKYNLKDYLSYLQEYRTLQCESDIETDHDKGLISIVLYNLIRNAEAASISTLLKRPTGLSGKDDIKVIVKQDDKTKEIVIRVEDVGRGILAEDSEKLTNMGFTKGGRGIGLANVKRYLDMAGATFKIANKGRALTDNRISELNQSKEAVPYEPENGRTAIELRFPQYMEATAA